MALRYVTGRYGTKDRKLKRVRIVPVLYEEKTYQIIRPDFYFFIAEHAGIYFTTSATSATAKLKGNLWGAAAKARGSPREALFT